MPGTGLSASSTAALGRRRRTAGTGSGAGSAGLCTGALGRALPCLAASLPASAQLESVSMNGCGMAGSSGDEAKTEGAALQAYAQEPWSVPCLARVCTAKRHEMMWGGQWGDLTVSRLDTSAHAKEQGAGRDATGVKRV